MFAFSDIGLLLLAERVTVHLMHAFWSPLTRTLKRFGHKCFGGILLVQVYTLNHVRENVSQNVGVLGGMLVSSKCTQFPN